MFSLLFVFFALSNHVFILDLLSFYCCMFKFISLFYHLWGTINSDFHPELHVHPSFLFLMLYIPDYPIAVICSSCNLFLISSILFCLKSWFRYCHPESLAMFLFSVWFLIFLIPTCFICSSLKCPEYPSLCLCLSLDYLSWMVCLTFELVAYSC